MRTKKLTKGDWVHFKLTSPREHHSFFLHSFSGVTMLLGGKWERNPESVVTFTRTCDAGSQSFANLRQCDGEPRPDEVRGCCNHLGALSTFSSVPLLSLSFLCSPSVLCSLSLPSLFLSLGPGSGAGQVVSASSALMRCHVLCGGDTWREWGKGRQKACWVVVS